MCPVSVCALAALGWLRPGCVLPPWPAGMRGRICAGESVVSVTIPVLLGVFSLSPCSSANKVEIFTAGAVLPLLAALGGGGRDALLTVVARVLCSLSLCAGASSLPAQLLAAAARACVCVRARARGQAYVPVCARPQAAVA